MYYRLHRLVCPTVLAIALGILAGGCDKVESESSQQDHVVDQKAQDALDALKEAQRYRDQANAGHIQWLKGQGTTTSPTTRDAEDNDLNNKAKAALDRAASLLSGASGANSQTKADPSLLAFSNGVNGEMQYDQAMVALNRLTENHEKAIDLINQLNILCGQLDANKAMISHLAMLNPGQVPPGSAGADALKTLGDEHENQKMRKAALQTELDAIQKQIDDVKGKIAAATNDKATVDASIADISQKKSQASGDASFELEHQMIDKQEASSNLGAQIEQLNLNLADFVRLAKGKTDEMAVLDDGMAKLDVQTKTLQDYWSKVQAIQAQRTLANGSLFGSATPPPEYLVPATQTAKQLAAVLDDLSKQYAQVQASLNGAQASYDTAASMAHRAGSELAKAGAPTGEAGKIWHSRMDLNSDTIYRAGSARVAFTRGEVYAMHALLQSPVAAVVRRFESIDPAFSLPDLKAKGDPTTNFDSANKALGTLAAADGDAQTVVKASDPINPTLAPEMLLTQAYAKYWIYALAYDQEASAPAPADPTQKRSMVHSTAALAEASKAYGIVPKALKDAITSRIQLPADLLTNSLPEYKELTPEEIKAAADKAAAMAPTPTPPPAGGGTTTAPAAATGTIADAISDKSVAVITVNLAKATPDDLAASIKAIMGDNPNAAMVAPMVAMVSAKYADAVKSFNTLSVVVSINQLGSPPDWAVLIDAKPDADLAASKTLLAGIFDSNVIDANGTHFWIHPQTSPLPAQTSPDLAKLYTDALGGADAPIVIVSALSKANQDMLSKVVNSDPTTPKPMADATNEILGARNTTIALTMGAAPSAAVTVEAADADAATKLVADLGGAFAAIKLKTPTAGGLVDSITPVATNNKVAFTVDLKRAGAFYQMMSAPAPTGGTPPAP